MIQDRKAFIKRRFGIDIATQEGMDEVGTLKSVIDSQAAEIIKRDADIEDLRTSLNIKIKELEDTQARYIESVYIGVHRQTQIDDLTKQMMSPKWCVSRLWQIFKS